MKDFSNYHKININDKIYKDSKFILDRSLQGYAGIDVNINGKESKILRFQRLDGNGSSYKIAGYKEDIERGNLITLDDEIFLVTTKPEDNRVYHKAIMTLCQTELPLVTEPEEVLIGYDKLKRPIYDTLPGTTELIPCVVEVSQTLSRSVQINEAINLLENQIRVTIPYREHPSLNYNETFNLYRDSYRIIRINDTEQIKGIGILSVTGERIESRGD